MRIDITVLLVGLIVGSTETSSLSNYEIHYVGETLRLVCSDVTLDSLDWIHRSVGSPSPVNLYNSENGISHSYKHDGRYSVKLDIDAGTSVLVIEQIKIEDAGTYSCKEEDVGKAEIELIVLDVPLECHSNTDLNSVLIPNDCGLEPDQIRLNCSLVYHGNRAPVLRWRQSNNPDSIQAETIHSGSTSGSCISYISTLLSNIQMNQTRFVCSIENLATDIESAECATQEILVSYFFNDTKSISIKETSQPIVELSCTANTSEHCSYQWQADEVQTNNRVQLFGQTIRVAHNYNNVRCYATCMIRGKSCVAQPVNVDFNALKHINNIEENNSLVKILVPIVVLLLLALAAAILIGWYCERKVKRKYKLGDNVETNELNESVKNLLIQPTDDHPVIEFIRKNENTLIRCLDIENGFASCLLSKQLLNSEQWSRITNRLLFPQFHDQNRVLLSDMILPQMRSESRINLFMEALIESDQKHIYNFIQSSGKNQSEENYDRILSDEELERIDRNTFLLETLIDVTSEFFDILLKSGCITERHKNRINGSHVKEDKNKELIAIIRRRSYANFLTFLDALKKTDQRRALLVLEHKTGSVISVHCETTITENGHAMDTTESKRIENKMADLLTNCISHRSPELKQKVNGTMTDLNGNGIHLIAATPTGSIVVYYFCETFRSIVVLKEMVDEERMKVALETVFDRLLKESDAYKITLTVSLDQTEYQNCIHSARRTIYQENDATDTAKECYIRHLPREMLEIIVRKSFVYLMAERWMVNAKAIETTSMGYGLFEILSKKSTPDVYMHLKSVAYGINVNKEVVLGKFFLDRLREHNAVITDLLNFQCAIQDSMDQDEVVTRNMAAGSYWMQFRMNRQIINQSNISFLECLQVKSCSLTLDFLKLMDEFGWTHIVNRVISTEKLPSFGDIWPLNVEHKDRMKPFQTYILNEMNIMLLVKNENQPKKGFDKNCGLRDTELYRIQTSNDLNDDTSSVSSRTSSTSHGHSQVLYPNRHNLIDLLYKEKCISTQIKQYIEQRPTLQSQNVEMLQCIRGGSLKTFNIAIDYFEKTGQQKVSRMLTGRYYSKAIKLLEKFEIKEETGVAGVTWFENEIVVVCKHSDIVRIFPDHAPFVEIENKRIVIQEMQYPKDIAACNMNRSLFISDEYSKSLWRIQMPDREITRFEMDCHPGRLSISPSNELLVAVMRDDRAYLELYDSSTVSLTKSIPLPTWFDYTQHAVQASSGNFIVSYFNKLENVYLISELSSDGEHLIRAFRLLDRIQLRTWRPVHLSLDESGQIFVADSYRGADRVLFNSRSTVIEILLDKYLHHITRPARLCYLQEKKQLIVGQQLESSAAVSIFNLC